MTLCQRVHDYWWFLRSLAHRARLLATLAATHPSDPRATIVLIPGIYEGRSQLAPLAQKLQKTGYRVIGLPALGLLTGSTAELAQMVAKKLTEIAGPVILLAHSKGGLVGHEIICHYPQLTSVKGLIAIATPWQGSYLARFFPPISPVHRLAPHGSDLGELTDDHPGHERIFSLVPRWDPHVPESGYLAGAHNIRLSSSGHFYPLHSPQTAQIVARCVEKLLSN